MATTKYILNQIKLEGKLQELIAKSDAELVSVLYNGSATTLAAALTAIGSVDDKIQSAINDLIGGAPQAYDTLKEIADYIASHKEVADALDAAITNKVDKVKGKGLSTEDFTTALKTKLDALPAITAENMTAWDAKADKTVASATADGLMSAADKTRLDALHGVYVGAEAPSNMQDGDLFVRLVSEA